MAETTTITNAYEEHDPSSVPLPTTPDTLESAYIDETGKFPDIPADPVEFTNGVSDLPTQSDPTKPNTLENVYSSSESGDSEEENEEEEEENEEEEEDECIRENDKEECPEYVYLAMVDEHPTKYHESRKCIMAYLESVKNQIVVRNCGQYSVSVDSTENGYDIYMSPRNLLSFGKRTCSLRISRLYKATN